LDVRIRSDIVVVPLPSTIELDNETSDESTLTAPMPLDRREGCTTAAARS